MLIIVQIYLLIALLFLAGKDASSYLLKSNNNRDPLTLLRIKRWHRDGAFLYLLYILPSMYLVGNDWWIVAVSSLLIRLSVFDLAFNKWANLDIDYLGSTADADKFFAKIFGANGAVKKSLFFAIVLIIFNIVVAFV